MTEATESRTWGVTEARAHLNEPPERAIQVRPQAIIQGCQEITVMASADEGRHRPNRTGSLADFLAAAPLYDSDLHIDRVNTSARNVTL